MMAELAGTVLDWAAARRRRRWSGWAGNAIAVQEESLRRLVTTARDTEFGPGSRLRRASGRWPTTRTRVPLRDYLAFKPLWERRARRRRADVTWPGRPRQWVKTSGTTAGDKVIPVTREAMAAHRRGRLGRPAARRRASRRRAAAGRPMLFLGGSTTLQPAARSGSSAISRC